MIGRTLRALAHVGPRQLSAIVYRRFVPVSRPHRATGPIAVRRTFVPAPFLRRPANAAGEFRFLEQTLPQGDRIDWRAAAMPRLWRFHLHAFDWLRDEGRDTAASFALLEEWVTANPPGTPDAWAPYTVSRRIGNWIDLFTQPAAQGFITERLRTALAQHALVLEANVERHLRANHYLENARALLLAGTYFEGNDADRWRATGERILETELDEQILPDGGHIERSPMYHSLVLEALLDLLGVARSNPEIGSPRLVGALRAAAARALRFLAAIVLPDGDIPLLNDAALGEAPLPETLFRYGVRVGAWDGVPQLGAVRALESTGYYVVRDGDEALLVDCGPLGAPYQSGHGHADTLSYEYALAGRRLVTDTGVFGYEDDARRRYARSAGAHSTVTVDGEEPCELWGTFRVGRRAEPIEAAIAPGDPGTFRFAGAHDGFRRLRGAPSVRRTLSWSAGSLQVVDDVAGEGEHEAVSRITLAPGIEPRREGDSIVLSDARHGEIAHIRWSDDLDVSISSAERYPRFGSVCSASTVALRQRGRSPLRIAYRIESSLTAPLGAADARNGRSDHQ